MGSTEVEIKATTSAPVHLSPTLIIGLGGTGADILLRIRKKFFEKFGGIEEFPIVSYLWFDTDNGYKDVGAKQFVKKVNFTASEEHMLSIADTGSIIGNLDKSIYRNIASWWPTGLNIIPHLDEGAGQYRPYSRLGLYYHYSRANSSVRQAIVGALAKIQNPASIEKVMHSPKLQRLHFAADLDVSKRNVYLIGSLAGGTGSGMFLDVARIVHYLAADAELVGFLATSRIFPQAKPRMHANTYAALLELDYYNAHNFRPNWSNDEVYSELRPPLFNYCYLLDSTNAAHLKLGAGADDHKKMYETIAENVFKDFSQGPFAQAKRSARKNGDHFMALPAFYPPNVANSQSEENERVFRQKFNRNYGSFGLASISVPHDRIITACAHKLAAELILYWKGQGASDTDIPQIALDVDHFLVSQEVLLDTNSILARLDDAAGNAQKSGAGGSLLTQIVRFAVKTADMALARPVIERTDFIDSEVTRFRNEQLNAAARSQNSGLMLRCIDQNATRILESGIKAIELCCDHRIDEEKLSVLSTTAFALRCCEVFEQQIKDCAAQLSQLTEIIQTLESEYNQRMTEMRSHAVRHNLDFRKNTILTYDMERILEVIVGTGTSSDQKDENPGLLMALRQKAIIEKAIEIYNSLVASIRGGRADNGEFLGGIVTRLQGLDKSFDSASKTLQNDAHYFEDKQNEDLSLVLFESSDVDKIYYPRYVNSATVKSISDRARNELKLTAASVKNSEFLKQQGGSDKLIDLCRELFEPIRSDYHIIDVFFSKFKGVEGPDGQPEVSELMKAELNQVFRSSRYWAEGGMDAVKGYSLEEGQEERHVGLPDIPSELNASDRDRIERRREAIKQYLTTSMVDSKFHFDDIPETSEIIFYNELSGVPLNFYSSMGELRSAYRQVAANEAALHLESKDTSKFEDFLILTNEETERLMAAFRCFTLGSIFDEIWVKPGDANKPVFGYSETVRGVDSNPRMGDERSTISFLQMRKDVLDKLARRTQDKYEEILAEVRSTDGEINISGREKLVAVAAIAIRRMEALEEQDDQHDWRKLPMYSKMEYLALSSFNDRLHADAQWPTFSADLVLAKRQLEDLATQRIDGRYALRSIVSAAAL